ncbi:efflux RND transporter periplasmic adaptor subunit [Demequina sp. NBRC 110054]|uniref:efflux RND transporter periplasmic adaptor subunit n=1 Tax=Demequina sp. NBRC 110054 TaxID=1570343 RepID=UPI0013564577|nr:biotin/lipoyl-binding protein [Demequina sp. NBRC 110054]
MPKISLRWNRARKWVIPAAALVAGAGVGVGAMYLWGPSSAGDQEAFAMEGMEDAGQQTMTVSLQTLEESVEASGTLAAVSTDSLSFDASGEVTAVYFEEGDYVEEGDVIAEIDTLSLTASLTSAKAELAQAKATLSNLEDADDGSDASEAQIEAAESQVAVLKASVADAKEAMDDAELVADMDGLLTSQPYEVGDVVSGGSSSSSGDSSTMTATSTSTSSDGVTIVGQDEWTVSVSLSEDEVALIEEGDQVTFTSDDVDEEFYGIVTDIANLPTTTGGSATYAVELQVTDTIEGLYEGTSVTADIAYLRQTDVLAIPTNAITTTDDVSTVTVVDDEGNEETREVTLGDAIDSYTIITDGLEEGESIVVTTTASSDGTDSDSTDDFSDMMGGFSGEMPSGDMGGAPAGGMPGQ